MESPRAFVQNWRAKARIARQRDSGPQRSALTAVGRIRPPRNTLNGIERKNYIHLRVRRKTISSIGTRCN